MDFGNVWKIRSSFGIELPVGLFGGQLLDLDVKGRKQQGSNRTEPVENGEKSVFDRRNPQNTAVIGATSIPRDKYGGYGTGILQGAAEVLGGESPILIGLTEHLSGYHDGKVLVRRRDVQGETAAHRAGKKSECRLGHGQEGLSDNGERADAFHYTAKDHSADNQPYRAQHSRHAPCREQVAQYGIVRRNGGFDSYSVKNPHVARFKAKAVRSGNARDHLGLENQGENGSQERTYQ